MIFLMPIITSGVSSTSRYQVMELLSDDLYNLKTRWRCCLCYDVLFRDNMKMIYLESSDVVPTQILHHINASFHHSQIDWMD